MLILKYILFCIIAILVNLGMQRSLLYNDFLISGYVPALILGTLAGLFTKFILDKFFIFEDMDSTILGNTKKLYAYTLNGIITTLIFWSVETVFYIAFETSLAREVGAIIGLSIGYLLKFNLDKRFVFIKKYHE